jgi:hypothetical protein
MLWYRVSAKVVEVLGYQNESFVFVKVRLRFDIVAEFVISIGSPFLARKLSTVEVLLESLFVGDFHCVQYFPVTCALS